MDSNKIFTELKSILEKYEPKLALLHNTNDNYYLNTAITERSQKSEFFAAVQVKKTYVAFHLMPVYYFPELLAGLSEELKRKMQGKSCFNFQDIDPKLFAELTTLTKKCFEQYRSLNRI